MHLNPFSDVSIILAMLRLLYEERILTDEWNFTNNIGYER